MNRPYIGKSIEDLEQLFAEDRRDRLTLQKLRTELQHRNAKRSGRLLDDVTAALTGLGSAVATDSKPASERVRSVGRLSRPRSAPMGDGPGERQPDFDAEADAKPLDDRRRPVQLSIMRPPGSAGLPDPWVPTLDQSLSLSIPPGADLPALYIEALGELIAEIRRTGSGQKRYELAKGYRVSWPGCADRLLYTFPFQDEAELFEEARVEVEVLGRRTDATVVSISDGKLTLALDEDVGDELARATLVIDSTALLDALKERLESASNGQIALNKKLADAVVGRGEPPATTEPIPAIATHRLNRGQKVAQGIKVRCITRPPHRNGSMDPALGKEALDMLEAIGCVVDCRAKIHEKVIIVDENVVWHGSLNALSHAHLSDEIMTRVANDRFARAVAANIARRQHSPDKAAAVLTEAENPRCGRCGARSVYAEGRHGGYYYCEQQCGWKGNLKSAGRGKAASGGQEESAGGERRRTPGCPECGGETHLRRGPYGEFFGCARYPKCTGKVDASKPRSSKPRGKRNSRARAGVSW